MYNPSKVDDFILSSEKTVKDYGIEKGFLIISSNIDNCENIYLNDYIVALNMIRHEKVLDWIEKNEYRISNVGINWGHLAASSNFSWERAENWLSKGRPLSLIALDALMFCTTIGERLNQSLWMRQIKPQLIDKPNPEMVVKKLQEYLKIDNVPRTRNTIQKIINYIEK